MSNRCGKGERGRNKGLNAAAKVRHPPRFQVTPILSFIEAPEFYHPTSLQLPALHDWRTYLKLSIPSTYLINILAINQTFKRFIFNSFVRLQTHVMPGNPWLKLIYSTTTASY
jgi:hypothetical protein